MIPFENQLVMKKKVTKFAYPCDIESQKLCSKFPTKKDIFVTVESDPVAVLRVEKYDNGVRNVNSDFLGLDGEESKEVALAPTLRFSSDVRLILHVKDLAKKYGTDFASRLADRFNKASQFQQQLDQLSDADILNTVRSRHIQTPSEIKAYSEMLLDEAAALQKEYNNKIAEAQAKAQAESESQASQTTAPAAAPAASSE